MGIIWCDFLLISACKLKTRNKSEICHVEIGTFVRRVVWLGDMPVDLWKIQSR